METPKSEDDEEWLRVTPIEAESPETTPTKKRRPRKVITLDDILEADHKASVRKQKPKHTSKKSKLKSHLYSSSSDDDDNNNNEEEDRPAPQQMLDELEKQVGNVAGEEVEPEWGLPVLLGSAHLETLTPICGGAAPVILRALQESSSEEEGREALSVEGLARSGFLRSWAVYARRCDASTLRWAYHQMAYSSEESLERATCRFLCDLVSRVSTDAEASFELAWLPNLVDLKQTFTVYGYREHEEGSEDTDMPSNGRTPPAKNLRSMLDFIATCFMRRTTAQPYYEPADVAKLLVIMVHLTLERGLLEILDKIQDCILVLLRYFTTEEWEAYCSHDFNGIAGMISEFTRNAQNVVFVLGVMSGLGKRSGDLQRHVALHELTVLGRRRKLLAGPSEVAALFENVNLRAKFVDFKRLYYEVVIADTFLWGNEGDDAARLAWLKFLRSCSRQIYIGDERPFATRLRNTASFLVQKYEHESSSLPAATVSD